MQSSYFKIAVKDIMGLDVYYNVGTVNVVQQVTVLMDALPDGLVMNAKHVRYFHGYHTQFSLAHPFFLSSSYFGY